MLLSKLSNLYEIKTDCLPCFLYMVWEISWRYKKNLVNVSYLSTEYLDTSPGI